MTTPPLDSFVSLTEFQRLTGLSDSATLWLIKHNKLALAYSRDQGIRVDAADASTRLMVEAMIREHEALLSEDESLLMERISALIRTHLESIFETAQARLGGSKSKPS